MPNFKSISLKMAVLQGAGQNLPSPCVCYLKDPMFFKCTAQSLFNILEMELTGKRVLKTQTHNKYL